MHPFIRYWLPVIVYCAFIFVQSSYPSPDKLPSFAYSDKLMHLVAYGVLGVMMCRALNTIRRWQHRWGMLFLIGVAASTAYGLSDEWHQSFVPGRNAELSDLAADFAGSLAGCWIYLTLLYSRLKSTSV